MSVPFTQYLMPDGRPTRVEIDRPEEIEAMARSLIEYGCCFEIEMLRDGNINMEVMRDDECVTGRMCGNGPGVPVAVDAMIREAFETVRDELTSVP
jgi:hypothetical protein